MQTNNQAGRQASEQASIRTVIFDVAQVVPTPSSSPQPGSHGQVADAGFVTSRLYYASCTATTAIATATTATTGTATNAQQCSWRYDG
jgi:hypothetical protein